MRCGKGLNKRKYLVTTVRLNIFTNIIEGLTEIHIQFKESKYPCFVDVPSNELVIKVSPAEQILFNFNNKVPGLECKLTQTELELTYKTRFHERVPAPYERLIYDILQADHSVFVRSDEVKMAWQIFTPVLRELEEKGVVPIEYEFGSSGPKESNELLEKYGFVEQSKKISMPCGSNRK